MCCVELKIMLHAHKDYSFIVGECITYNYEIQLNLIYFEVHTCTKYRRIRTYSYFQFMLQALILKITIINCYSKISSVQFVHLRDICTDFTN